MKQLTLAQLNRTYLQRQRLLTPSDETPLELVRALGAVQAQEGPAPYFALWARSNSFQREDLDIIRKDKQVVRAHLNRNTVHLLATEDFLAWFPLYVEKLERQIARWGPDYQPVDKWRLDLVKQLEGKELSPKDIVGELEQLLPHAAKADVHPFYLIAALELVRTHGPEGESLGVKERWITSQTYLGRRPGVSEIDSMVTRYLESYGPASPADFSAWSGLPTQRALFEAKAKAGAFVPYTNEDGKVLYDVLGGTILTGEEEVQAVQLLGDFDNAILSHQDRRRIVSDEVRATMNTNIRSMAPLMVEGQQVGVWQVSLPKKGAAKATLQPFVKLTKLQRASLESLAHEALAMGKPDRDHQVAWR